MGALLNLNCSMSMLRHLNVMFSFYLSPHCILVHSPILIVMFYLQLTITWICCGLLICPLIQITAFSWYVSRSNIRCVQTRGYSLKHTHTPPPAISSATLSVLLNTHTEANTCTKGRLLAVSWPFHPSVLRTPDPLPDSSSCAEASEGGLLSGQGNTGGGFITQ